MSVNVVKTILAKGYFPKELPPAFTTHSFAEFAVTPSGASLLSNYKPTDCFTECCEFKVARTGNESRDFKIPHPHHFTKLTNLRIRISSPPETRFNFAIRQQQARLQPFLFTRDQTCYSFREPHP